jgi:hypothetical protein
MKKYFMYAITALLLPIGSIAQKRTVSNSLSLFSTSNNLSVGYGQADVAALNNYFNNLGFNNFRKGFLDLGYQFGVTYDKFVSLNVQLNYHANLRTTENNSNNNKVLGNLSGTSGNVELGVYAINNQKYGIKIFGGVGANNLRIKLEREAGFNNFNQFPTFPNVSYIQSRQTIGNLGMSFYLYSRKNVNNLTKGFSGITLGYRLAGKNDYESGNNTNINGPAIRHEGFYINLFFGADKFFKKRK